MLAKFQQNFSAKVNAIDESLRRRVRNAPTRSHHGAATKSAKPHPLKPSMPALKPYRGLKAQSMASFVSSSKKPTSLRAPKQGASADHARKLMVFAAKNSAHDRFRSQSRGAKAAKGGQNEVGQVVSAKEKEEKEWAAAQPGETLEECPRPPPPCPRPLSLWFAVAQPKLQQRPFPENWLAKHAPFSQDRKERCLLRNRLCPMPP